MKPIALIPLCLALLSCSEKVEEPVDAEEMEEVVDSELAEEPADAEEMEEEGVDSEQAEEPVDAEKMEEVVGSDGELMCYVFTMERLKPRSEELAALKDKAEADAYAKEKADDCLRELQLVMDYVRDNLPDETPRMQQFIRNVRQVAHDIASVDTHGSEALECMLWGWKHLDGLSPQDPDYLIFRSRVENYYWYSKIPERLEEVVADWERCGKLSDGEEDEVEGEVSYCSQTAVFQGQCADYPPAPEAFDKWMTQTCGTTLAEAGARIAKSMAAIKAQDFYGSKTIENAVHLYENRAQVFKTVDSLIEQNAEVLAEFKAILKGITDKASADAAVERLELCVKKIQGIMEQVAGSEDWDEGGSVMVSIFSERSVDNAGLKELMKEVGILVKKLMETDNPCYGSEALKSYFMKPKTI